MTKARAAITVLEQTNELARAELRDLDLDASELGRHIMAIMTACVEHRGALERRAHHERE